ncbi:hypothetical protein HID58_067895, partial [Brassica napus]
RLKPITKNIAPDTNMCDAAATIPDFPQVSETIPPQTGSSGQPDGGPSPEKPRNLITPAMQTMNVSQKFPNPISKKKEKKTYQLRLTTNGNVPTSFCRRKRDSELNNVVLKFIR